MKINRYSRYKMIEKKNVIIKIIYTYNFKDHKTLIKESSFFCLEKKTFNEETQKQINCY